MTSGGFSAKEEECSSVIRYFEQFRDGLIRVADRFGTPTIIDFTSSHSFDARDDDREGQLHHLHLQEIPTSISSSSTSTTSLPSSSSSSSSPSSSLTPFSEVESSWITPHTLREQLKRSRGGSNLSSKTPPRIVEAKYIVLGASTLMFSVTSLIVGLACHFRARYCVSNVPTLSYAANFEPMTTLFRYGCYTFSTLMISTVFSMHIHFRIRLDNLFLLSSPSSRDRFLGLRFMNSLMFFVSLLSLFIISLHSSLPQRDWEPWHTLSGFTYLGLTAIWIGGATILFLLTGPTNQMERKLLGYRLALALWLLVCAIITAIEASFAYCCRTAWLNPRFQAIAEFTTVQMALIYYLPVYYETSHYGWTIEFPPSLVILHKPVQ